MISIFSLTDQGKLLGQRLVSELAAEHLHKPENFAATVQQKLAAGHRLILICATGIAVRSIAPALKDKHRDPAVLVMDEKGRFVIPLISGHEGGANDFAHRVAKLTDGQCIITGPTLFTQPLYVAGIGCEKNCPLDYIQSLMQGTLRSLNLHHVPIAAISSIDLKQHEPAIVALAEQLNIPFVTYGATDLQQMDDKLSTKSDVVFREVGVYGVAEAAALFHAQTLTGNDAELIIPKHKNTKATFALARAYLNQQ
ncbi:MAG: cobalamin biosynthesis protein [Gammaproteobacteria bacterium]|nr:cobalamin biosynthesis protein [Gammaproteobacteria bacterium]